MIFYTIKSQQQQILSLSFSFSRFFQQCKYDMRQRCKQSHSCICIFQKMESYQKQELFQWGDFSNQKMSVVSVQSQYKDKYLDFFNLWENVYIKKDKKQLIEILSRSNIHYSHKTFNPFIFRIIGSSHNFQICEAELSWGYFKMTVGIINNLKESCFHQNILSEGCFGKIYQFCQKKKNSIIKCCSLSSDSEINQKLKRMIFKQYFISKIAAVLNIGPKIVSQTGFDISVYANCIQFSIEKCKKIRNIDQQSQSHLCQNLQMLHLLKIIHFDIKPENVMWSSSLRRIVFIDFGLSQIVDCDIGWKYPINFKGTPNFCTQEMLQIFQSSEKADLDVYYNDVFCLKQSINLLSRSGSQLQLQTIQDQCYNCQNHVKSYKIQRLAKQSQLQAILISRIKSSLYFQQKDLFNRLCQNFTQKDHKIIKQIMQFLSQNYTTNCSRQFYNKFVPTLIKSSYKYDWINSTSNSLYFKQNSNQHEVTVMRSFYDAYYSKLVDREDSQFNNFFITKKMAQDIISSFNFKGGKEKLFKIFMSYVSFTNNIYRCTVEEKLLAARKFIAKVPDSIKTLLSPFITEVEQPGSSEEQLLQILTPIFRYIINHFITNTNQMLDSYSLNQESRFQLIFDILEHCFLFKIFQRNQLMKIINDIYESVTKSQEYKLQMILKIRSYNKWFLFSNKYTSQISFSVISKWTQKMEQTLLKNTIFADKIIQYSNQIFKVPSQTQFSILDCQRKSNILPTLLIELQIQQFFNKLSSMNPKAINIVLNKLYKMIPHAQKAKIFSIHLHLFFIYNNKFKNYQQRDVIYHRFQQNIQSSILMQSSILKKIMKMSHKNRLKQQMDNFIGFLQFANIRSINFIAEPIQNTARVLQCKGFAKYSEKQHKDRFFDQFSRILINLKNINEQIYDGQDCIFRSVTHSWFQLKVIHMILKKQGVYDLAIDLLDLQSLIQKEENNLTRFKMRSCLAWMKQHSLFLLRPRNYIEDIIAIHKQLKQYHSTLSEQRQNCMVVAYMMQNYHFLLKICYQLRQFNPICCQAYLILYQFTKMTNSYYYYIYLLNQCPIIIYSTLHAVMYKKDLLEVAELIKMILTSLHYVESFFHLGELIQSFYKFIIFQQRAGNHTLFTFLEEYFSKFQESQPYVIIYYFSCFQGMLDPKQKKKYLLKVLKNISRLPKKLIYSFACFLYHSLLRQLSLVFNIQFNDCGINDESKLTKKGRKRKFLRQQLMKAQIIQFQRKISRFQQKKHVNPFKKSLFSKCYKIKSLINDGRCQILSIKPLMKLFKKSKQGH